MAPWRTADHAEQPNRPAPVPAFSLDCDAQDNDPHTLASADNLHSEISFEASMPTFSETSGQAEPQPMPNL